MRAERQAARLAAEAARRKQRNSVVAVGVVLLLVLGAVFAFVAGKDGDKDDEALEPGDSATCTWNKTGTPSRPVVEPSTSPTVIPASATLATNRGTIAFTLNANAPCAAASMASLASQGFYDNTPCHRLTTEGLFVLQCGDPSGTGTGGPGYQFAEEALTGATYKRGTVAMAKGSAAGSTGSQFFIVYKDSPLDPLYTPVGTVTKGLEVVDAVAKAGSVADPKTGNTAPKLPIKIATLRTNNPAGAAPTTAPAATTPAPTVSGSS